MEVCLSSNYHTGAVGRGEVHPLAAFLEAGVPVSLCCDNSTVSRTDALRESVLAALRERRSDILLLARHFAARMAMELTFRDGRLRVAVPLAVTFPPVVYQVFAHLLRVPLPRGWLGW